MSAREDRRAMLLAAAREVILRHGYRKAGLGDVAQEAGVSRATVYNYFSSKEQLFEAIVDEEVTQLALAVAGSLEPSAPPAAQLLAYVRARRRQIERLRDVYVLTLNVGREALPIAEKSIQAQRSRERAFIAGLLRAGIARGDFRPVDADQLAAVLHSAMRGLDEAYVFEHDEEPSVGAELLIQTLLNGLLREPREDA
ncbi:MAG: helix-turn-helix domain-containing protein [Pseudomonadota bacterium]